MQSYSKLQSIGTTVAAIALGATVFGLASNPAHAASDTGATISVDPSASLSDGQTVNVTGSGFTPGSIIFIGQCKSATESTACDLGSVTGTTATADGTISSTFTVHSGFDATDTRTGTPAGRVDCGGTAGCVLTAGNGEQAANLVTITFGG
jgi:hypothetical protein